MTACILGRVGKRGVRSPLCSGISPAEAGLGFLFLPTQDCRPGLSCSVPQCGTGVPTGTPHPLQEGHPGMSNPEHLKILDLGLIRWNTWRRKHPDVTVDLAGASLNSKKLSNIDFSEANLSGADLSSADLHRANLKGANAEGTDLRQTNLDRANLPGARLMWADLSSASLIGADLRWANLSRANMHFADLTNARLGSLPLMTLI